MKQILLHGLGQGPSSWEKTVKALDDGQESHCPDLAKWIHSEKLSYSNLYKAFKNYCEQFYEPLNICGLSLGGTLALQYGLEHPEKVHSLVLIGTQYKMPKKLLHLQNMIFRIMPQSVFSKMGFGKSDFINLTKSMMELDFQEDLGKLNCPILVVCGEKDRANKKASLQLKELLQKAELSIIPNAGHEVNKENPETLADALRRFYLEIN